MVSPINYYVRPIADGQGYVGVLESDATGGTPSLVSCVLLDDPPAVARIRRKLTCQWPLRRAQACLTPWRLIRITADAWRTCREGQQLIRDEAHAEWAFQTSPVFFFWVDYSCEENGRPEADGMGFPGNQPRLASYQRPSSVDESIVLIVGPTHASVQKKKKR